MEIRSTHMRNEETDTPPCDCSVCGNSFQPPDVLVFICPTCIDALKDHCPNCKGKYDDVVMDWGIDLDADKPYFWIIECLCGEELRSEPHGIGEQDAAAKSLHRRWIERAMFQNIVRNKQAIQTVMDAEKAKAAG